MDCWPSLWSGSHYNRADGVLIRNPNILVKGCMVVREGWALLVYQTFLGTDFNILNIYDFNDKHDKYDLVEDLQPHMLGRELF